MTHIENDIPLVSGQIILTAKVAALNDVTIHIRLEDISRVDASAAIMVEEVIPQVRHVLPGGRSRREAEGEGTVIPFVLRAHSTTVPIDPKHDYAVRVWVDTDSDGHEGPGDLYSDQSYRVLTHGFGNTVTITLDSR